MQNLIYIILIIFATVNPIQSQVVIFSPDEIGSDETTILGPANVSIYFPSQSQLYINKYLFYEERIQAELEQLEEELSSIKPNKYRYTREIGELEDKIDKCNLKLELISEIILDWETHDTSFTKFYKKLKDEFQHDTCYCIQINKSTYCDEEIIIRTIYPKEEFSYKELLRNNFQMLCYVLRDDVKPKPDPLNPNLRSTELNEETMEYRILNTDFQKQLTYKYSYRNKTDASTNNDISDYGEKFMEHRSHFDGFDWDTRTLYNETKAIAQDTIIQIRLYNSEFAIIPDEFYKKKCE